MYQTVSELVDSLIARYFAYWQERDRLRYLSENLTASPMFVSNIAEVQEETNSLD